MLSSLLFAAGLQHRVLSLLLFTPVVAAASPVVVVVAVAVCCWAAELFVSDAPEKGIRVLAHPAQEPDADRTLAVIEPLEKALSCVKEQHGMRLKKPP